MALQQLERIEAEMRRIGFWTDTPPQLEAIESGQVFPTFEQWLQCVFLPKAREDAKKGKSQKNYELGLQAMREYDYHSRIEEAHPLMCLLRDYDKLGKNHGSRN